jgi:hypothetical protein
VPVQINQPLRHAQRGFVLLWRLVGSREARFEERDGLVESREGLVASCEKRFEEREKAFASCEKALVLFEKAFEEREKRFAKAE